MSPPFNKPPTTIDGVLFLNLLNFFIASRAFFKKTRRIFDFSNSILNNALESKKELIKSCNNALESKKELIKSCNNFFSTK